MSEVQITATIALAALAAVVVVTVAGLVAWRDWLRLTRDRLADRPAAPASSTRIEIADLRERVRKLEALAAGVEW